MVYRHLSFYLLLFVTALLASCIKLSVDDDPAHRASIVSSSEDYEQRLLNLEYRLDLQDKYRERTDMLVSSGYNTTNLILVALTVIIAFVAIYVTWFITHAEKKFRRIEKTVSEKETKVQDLVDRIDSNIPFGLFQYRSRM